MRGVLWLALVLSVLPLQTVAAQQAPPQPIAYGQSVTGSLSTAQIEVLYVFSAKQGDSIIAAMDLKDGTLDPLLILVDESQQTVLAVDNDSGGNHNARLRFVIPTDGNFVIKATAVQGSGDIQGTYTLSLMLDSSAPLGAANGPLSVSDVPIVAPFIVGEELKGDLSDTVQFRLYVIRIRKSEPIIVTLDIADSPNKLQAGMYLYTPDFHEVERAELGQPLNVKATADTLYFLIVARAAASGAGSYTLRQTLVAKTSTPAITPGQTVRGLINNDNAVKTYSLQGSAGQAITARLRRLSGDLITYLYVVSIDNGKTIAQATDSNGVAELSVVLPAIGTYAVVATRGGQQTGTTSGEFALTVSQPGQTPPLPPEFQNYATLDYGDKPTGTVDDTTYAVPYVFSAQAGDVIQATMSAVDGNGDLDAYLLLQNVKGETLAEDDNSGGGKNAHLQITIPETGQYALVATRANLAKGTTSGAFTLVFDTVSLPQSDSLVYGTPLVTEQAQPAIQGSAVGGLYHFDAQPDTAVSVDLAATDGLQAVTMLTDTDFKQIAAANGSISSTLIKQSAPYYIFVVRAGGPNQPAAGSYTITLKGAIKPTPTLPPGVLAFDQPVTGKITNEVYQVRYTVQAQQNMTLTVTMDAAPGSTLDPLVGITDADNNVLGVNDDTAAGLKNATLTVTTPKAGLYTIVATRSQEARGNTVGDFILTIKARQTGPDILPIAYGGVVNGEIVADRFLYYYTFTGSAGDLITIKMNHVPGNELDPLLYLYDYTGGKPKLIAGNNDASAEIKDAAIIRFKLSRSGPYLIAATRADAAQGKTIGTFVLTLTKDN
ncbi:MAG: hypothetical protein ABI947_03360 [Chloroflexota bacterium]